MIQTLLAQAQAAFGAGRFDAAQNAADAAIALEPSNLVALSIKANAAMRLEDADALLDALQRLHALRPDDAAIRRNLATVLNRRGNRALDAQRFAAADADWRAAIALEPMHRDARFNLAGSLRRAGQWAEALPMYEALHREQAEPAVTVGIADCLTQAGRHDEARAMLASVSASDDLRDAVIQIATRAGDHVRAADELLHIDDDGERLRSLIAAQRDAMVARRDADPLIERVMPLHRIGERSPQLQVALTRALALPDSLLDRAEIDTVRTRFAAGLDWLVSTFDDARLKRCAPGLAQIEWSNFLLAYHGRDDLALQTRFGDWLHRATDVLGARLMPIAERRKPGPLRIGLVSAHWYYCTVGSYFGSWIDALGRLDAELHLVQLLPREDDQTRAFGARAAHFHRFGPATDDFVASVRALDLDLVVFPELGMDQRLFTAAAAGIARRQWMAWGHPVTSGLPRVSHYLTCTDMEPPGSASAYRETLRGLPGLGTRFALPPKPARRTRADVGLPEGPLAVVPQSIFKVLPSNDAIYARMLDGRGDLRIAFFGADHTADAARFRQRLARAVGDAAADRLCFLPEMSRARFLETIATCDLMIDTLGWSGGNSALDALRVGLPIVTCPGEFMRGRQCATMLRLLGIEGAFAADADQLTELALRRIADDGFRQHFRQQADAGLEALVDDPACDQALMTHIENALAD